MKGDISVAGQQTVLGKLRGRAGHHILEIAYEAMSEELRELLGRIAAFRSPIDYPAIEAVVQDGLSLDPALDELEQRGLLLRAANRYDLHPLVRKHAYEQLSDKAGVHLRLVEYFKAIPAPKRVESMEDLTMGIELYWHTVRGGQLDEAFLLYRHRLSQSLYFQFAAYQRIIELLGALFAEASRSSHLLDETDQIWALNSLANAYSVAGQAARAVPLFERHIELCANSGDRKNLAIGIGNLSLDQLHLGMFEVSESGLREKIRLCQEIRSEYHEVVGRQNLARVLAYQGRFSEAQNELDCSTPYWARRGDQQGASLAAAHAALLALLRRKSQAAAKAAGEARRLADVRGGPHDIIESEWLLGWAQSALGERPEAERHLNEALTRCRRINLIELEPSILLALARHHRDRNLALEALRIADRCQYRLNQADIHNLLARLALDDGNHAEALDHAQKAKDNAYCDGPPHYYKPAYEEAEGLLAEAIQAPKTPDTPAVSSVGVH